MAEAEEEPGPEPKQAGRTRPETKEADQEADQDKIKVRVRVKIGVQGTQMGLHLRPVWSIGNTDEEPGSVQTGTAALGETWRALDQDTTEISSLVQNSR